MMRRITSDNKHSVESSTSESFLQNLITSHKRNPNTGFRKPRRVNSIPAGMAALFADYHRHHPLSRRPLCLGRYFDPCRCFGKGRAALQSQTGSATEAERDAARDAARAAAEKAQVAKLREMILAENAAASAAQPEATAHV